MKFKNYQNKTTILIPMRALDKGKSRLSNILSQSSRARLVELLFTQLLKKLNILRYQFPMIFSEVIVITPCRKVKAISEEFNAIVLEETIPHNLNSALTLGLSWSSENGYASSLIIPGDIIDPLTKDIKKIITLGKKASQCMVISPSTDFGTNALFLTLPTKMRLKFGPNSFFEHQKEAANQSIKTIIAPLDSLKDDLDTGKDLKLLKTKKPFLFKTI